MPIGLPAEQLATQVLAQPLLPSDLIVAAADADPQLKDLVGPYSAMDALPASLAPAQARAREIYADGWRPPVPDGPTRDELSEVVSMTRAAA